MSKCDVCYGSFGCSPRSECCGNVCQVCLFTSLQIKIRENWGLPGLLNATCPICQTEFHEDFLRSFLSSQVFELYISNKTANFWPFKQFHTCPQCCVEFELQKDEETNKVFFIENGVIDCTNCGTMLCGFCDGFQDWHKGISCEAYWIWAKNMGVPPRSFALKNRHFYAFNNDNNNNDDDEEDDEYDLNRLSTTDFAELARQELLNHGWKNENTQMCKRCASRIEKDGGCEHVICTFCGHDFCWECDYQLNPVYPCEHGVTGDEM